MPDEIKIDLFKPAQPRIPGVADAEPEQFEVEASENPPEPVLPSPALERLRSLVPLMWFMLTVAGIFTTGAGLFLWSKKASDNAAPISEPVGTTQLKPPAAPPKDSGKMPMGPGPIAAAGELARPWSSKKFLFHNSLTNSITPALVVRLPGGALWGLSLREPYGDCEMQYVTSPQQLEANYGVRSSHPMVVDPCNRSVFDLSIYGNGPNGLVRGEIVAGSAVRPPLGIEIQTHGKEIVAVRAE